MSEATTTKPINPRQLAAELGGAELSMHEAGGQRTLVGTVSQAALDAGIAAHVAINEAGNRATLDQQVTAAMQSNRDDITANDTYLAITTPTTAQVAAQVKVLTAQSTRQARQLNGIARLILGKFDGTT